MRRAAALLAIAGCAFVHHHERATAVTATTTIITGLAILTPLTDCTHQPNDQCERQTLEAGGAGLAASAIIGAITASELQGGDWKPPQVIVHAEARPDTAAPDEPAAAPAPTIARTASGDGADSSLACLAAWQAEFTALSDGCAPHAGIATTDLTSGAAACNCRTDTIGATHCETTAHATCTDDPSKALVVGTAHDAEADAEADAVEAARRACAPRLATVDPTCTCEPGTPLCACIAVARCAQPQQ